MVIPADSSRTPMAAGIMTVPNSKDPLAQPDPRAHPDPLARLVPSDPSVPSDRLVVPGS